MITFCPLCPPCKPEDQEMSLRGCPHDPEADHEQRCGCGETWGLATPASPEGWCPVCVEYYADPAHAQDRAWRLAEPFPEDKP